MVEHVSGSEEEDQDETDCSPEVSILNDRHDVGVCHCCKGEEANEDSDGGNSSGIVHWSLDLRVATIRKMSSNPAVDAFCGLRSHEVHSDRLAIGLCIGSGCGRKE